MNKPRVKVKGVNVFRNNFAGAFQFGGTLISDTHPYLSNGTYITSSRIQSISFVDNTIETLNTVYEVEDEIKFGVE